MPCRTNLDSIRLPTQSVNTNTMANDNTSKSMSLVVQGLAISGTPADTAPKNRTNKIAYTESSAMTAAAAMRPQRICRTSVMLVQRLEKVVTQAIRRDDEEDL